MNVIISPSSGLLEFNSLSAGSSSFDSLNSAVRISFLNSGELNLVSYKSGVNNRFTVDGNKGRLFSVTDSFSGTLFSVNDIAGLPTLQVFDNDRVVMGQYAANTLVVSGQNVSIGKSPPSYKLDVAGKGEFHSIGFSGRASTIPSPENGDIWFDSGNNVLRTYIGNSNRTVGVAKTFATFTSLDHFRVTGTAWAPSGFRTGVPVLQFSDTTRQSTQFMGVVPTGTCLNSGITSRILWMAATGLTNSVVWGLEFESLTTDLDFDSYSAISSGTFATTGAAGVPNISTISATAIDGVVEGSFYRVRLTRLADVAADTMGGNAEFIMLELQATL